MTIMFAGGMTIAIPGELPTAVAQTGTLSVSAAAAGVFGGAQVIEIVVDDPDRADADSLSPDVNINEETVTMTQSATGKWYAYVAERTSYTASDLTADELSTGFLRDLPATGNGEDWPTDPIPIVQTYPFDDGDEVEITAGRSESVTLVYDDHSGIATIDVDRNDVPAGGQVHITISDFMLNLDPTAPDAWTLNADGSFGYNNFLVDVGGTDTPATIGFDGSNGVFGISGSNANMVVFNNDANTVVIEETRSNTGVFESEDGNISEISVHKDAASGDTFTIKYADDSQQVIVDDFSSTLELVADGTWNSGDTLTVRLTNENLNINTLDDDDMKIGDKDLPVLILGEPITLATIDKIQRVGDEKLGDNWSVNTNTHVATLTTTSNEAATFTVTLTEEQTNRLKDTTLGHYINYHSDVDAATNAHLNGTTPDRTTTPLPVGNGAKIVVDNNGDGIFNITFTPPALPSDSPLTQAAILDNNQIQNAVTNAAAGITATGVKTAVAFTTAPEEFKAAVAAIPVGDDDAEAAKSAIAEVKRIARSYLVAVEYTIVSDVFTLGENDDGETENHAIYRALLEETSSGSGMFEGTIEYKMLNQLSVDDPATYDDVKAMGDELVIILDDGYTGTSAPTVAYDGDHVREDAPTYTGEVSFDSDTYRVADEATVTLVDPDLNVDAGGIDIYTVDVTSTDETATLLHLEIGGCTTVDGFTSFSLRESADDSDTFEGSFEVPGECNGSTTTGEDISATYYDFRDASGGTTEWGDSATIGADTGSVSFDRTVYPVPADDSTVMVYVSVDDGDFDESSTSVEDIAVTEGDAPVTVKVGSTTIAELGTAANPLEETGVDTGVFLYALEVITTDEDYNLEQGSIITVTYDDPTDASGNKNSVSDSATFDLRNAVLQSDKSTYVIGQDALLTLIEPDLNLDSDGQETLPLTIIDWESDADDTNLLNGAFGAVPSNLRETDVNTGIFQVVITIPEEINGNALERGEEITLIYTDDGPSGADAVGETDRAVELQIETSDFGATIELDQNVYTWTDKVFITAVASDYNFDSNVIDEIGPENDGEITIRVRGDGLKEYRLAETGPDTGVFTGEITLAGFSYDRIDYTAPGTGGGGPTGGTLGTNNEDGLSVSFEYSDSEAPLVASALIRWNVGEVQWLEASYAATGSGIVRVIDPDMNTNPSAVDNIDDIVVYSETFLGGIELTVTETQEASGIFEGTVEFDPESASQGHRLQVTEGDIVTAEYDDYTLPPPDGEDDSLSISATTLIGSIVPPLERAPASNPAIVDAFGNSLASVSVDQQVQITADLTSGQDRDQDFAYLVQIQNEDGVTVELSWIAGTLGAGAAFSASQSWTPSETGSYTATIFVWESVSNPTALSPQLSITIDVV